MISKKQIIVKDKKVNTITFQLEELEKPAELLPEKSLKIILEKFSNKIEAHSKVDSDLVANGYHSFIYGMYQAYSEHRPFTLSPDMIWLLICQGFSNHVNFNHGTFMDVFPNLKGRRTLEVVNNNIKLGDSESHWDESTEQFNQQIANYIGTELLEALSANFSTTGIKEKVACEITVMDAMKPYFEYVVVYFICGIPEITLEGKEEDWLKILKKLDVLKKFNLSWWTEKLTPIIEEFVKASKGEIDQQFWMNMFKIHTKDEYGQPTNIDGWIINFYPYDREGNRIDLSEISDTNINLVFERLPKEIANVPFIYKVVDSQGNEIVRHAMEYWAGFIGLNQNNKDFTLRPEIGWFVCHENQTEKIQKEGIEDTEVDSRRYYNLQNFPDEIFETKWNELELNFINEIIIPTKIIKLKTNGLHINGKISSIQKKKLKFLLAGKDIRVIFNHDYS